MAPESDPGGQFDVDSGGAVRLVGGLDREAADTHSVLVWAVDQGVPPRTATATLSVSVIIISPSPSGYTVLLHHAYGPLMNTCTSFSLVPLVYNEDRNFQYPF